MTSRCFNAVVVVLCATALASCGGSTSDATQADAPSSAGSSEDAGAEGSNSGDSGDSSADGITADDDGPTPQTLEEYLGAAAARVRGGGGGGGAGFDTDQLLEEQRLIQIEIQSCMLSQGFAYTPEEVGDGLRFFTAAQAQGTSPQDYAETQGFGISTRFDAILEDDVDLGESVDPNDEHLATLSEGEADAWQFALQGEPPVRNDEGQLVNPATGEVVERGRGQATGGCRLQAQNAVRGDVAALADLEDKFAEVEERIDGDPAVIQIRRAWADCMLAEGFDYNDESAARADIRSQLQPLLRSFLQSSRADADDAGGEPGQQGGGGGNRLTALAGLELTDEQERELDALQDQERAIAVASLTCDNGGSEQIAEISLEYETQFVEENRAALEAIAR